MADSQGERADLVVGVDFGMTYTGVAWTNLTNNTQSISNWPGLGDYGHETKVPTKFVRRNDSVIKWGFLCDLDDADEDEELDELFECFKIYLDQDSIDGARQARVRNMPRTVDEAKRLIRDYLEQVYRQVKSSIEAKAGPWREKNVEFIFSLPTTWQTLDITNSFESAIREAGFGSENQQHSVKLELTEAEAAAVYVAGNGQVRFNNGDILLVCDAGGGTTDLGLLEVLDDNPDLPSLKQVSQVKGVGIGSTMIDRAFEDLVQRRLDRCPDARSLPEDLVYKLARSSAFRTIKHNFGSSSGNHDEYKIALHTLGLGIGPDLSHPGLRIQRGRMQFSRAEIQSLFDAQIRGITRRIDEQLDWMQANRGGEHVKYMILSGGLGGSPYVQAQIEQRYRMNPHPSAPMISVILSQEPRLSVVKGLVMDRRQRIINNRATIVARIARASYGVLCRQRYDPAIHIGADIEFDHYKKNQRWATNQIDWLIKKGDTINTDHSAREKAFSKKINPGDPGRKWDTTIIVSHNERDLLPRMLKQAGALKLCDVQSDLKEVLETEFDLKNKFCWQGKRYFLATFTVRVIIAPADLKFELWFKGQKYNRSHEPLTVQWDESGASARPPTNRGPNDNWESHAYRPAPGRIR